MAVLRHGDDADHERMPPSVLGGLFGLKALSRFLLFFPL